MSTERGQLEQWDDGRGIDQGKCERHKGDEFAKEEVGSTRDKGHRKDCDSIRDIERWWWDLAEQDIGEWIHAMKCV